MERESTFADLEGFLDPPPKRVSHFDDASNNSLILSLYIEDDLVRAWFVGPLSLDQSGKYCMAYAPRCEKTIACFALWRAHILARQQDVPMIVVDPDNLWPLLWDDSGF